jgi:carboxymethylenebutenolidase
MDHHHDANSSAGGTLAAPLAQQSMSVPAGSSDVAARLAASPRHGEYQMIKTGPTDSVLAWVVYPQRGDNAPVAVVIHEIFGLSTWIRGVQHIQGDTVATSDATAAIRTIKPADYQRQLEAVAGWGMNRPAAQRSMRWLVLGLYGGSDNGIGATAPGTDSVMKANGKIYEPHAFAGAAHGFLRQRSNPQTGVPIDANIKATEQAWPLTVGWLRKYLGA